MKQMDKTDPPRKVKNLVGTGVGVAVLVLLLLLSSWVPSENLALGQSELTVLDGPWRLLVDGQAEQTITLPFDYPAKANQRITLVYRFQADGGDGQMLRIRSSMQQVRVALDDHILFETDQPKPGRLVAPHISSWHLIPLPRALEGRDLTLVLTSPLARFAGIINPVVVGSGDALLMDLMRTRAATWPLVSFLLAFSVLALLASLFFRQYAADLRLVYLSVFSFLIAVWLFSENKWMQLLTGNRFVLGSISYLALTLMPLPLILYVRSAVLKGFQTLLAGLSALFLMLFGLILALQLTGRMAFIESAVISSSLILFSVLLLTACLMYEAIKGRNSQARQFLLASSWLALAAVLEVVTFLQGAYNRMAYYGRFGFVLFFVILSIQSIGVIRRLIEQEHKEALLMRLAYHDALTGARNRLAFERDLDALMPQAQAGSFWLMMVDINNLKDINDRYGHRTGDQVIRLCYETILHAVGDQGTCYRIGGDEFTCIMQAACLADRNTLVEGIRAELEQKEKNLPYRLQMAIGHDAFRTTDSDSASDFLHRIDQYMYADKMRQKQRQAVAGPAEGGGG